MTGPRDLLEGAAKAAVSAYRGRVLCVLHTEAGRLHREADEAAASPDAEAMARLEARAFEGAAMIVEAVPMEV